MPDPVDVIMPAYNAERWIARAAGSVLAMPGVRSLTISDDGSRTPVTEQLLGVAGDGRVRIVRGPNAGQSGSRNRGIDALLGATGPSDDDRSWAMFFDADDLLLPGAFEALDDAQRAGCAVCVGAREAFWEDGRRELFAPPADLRDTVLPGPDQVFRYIQIFGGGGMCLRRSILRSGERWDPQISHSSDIEFLRRAAEHSGVWVSTRCFLRYRRHETEHHMSSRKHAAHRARSFARVVQRHASPANDGLLRQQAAWLINQVSKHATDRDAFEIMLRLHTSRGWPVPIKPRVRARVRRLVGSLS